MVKPIFMADYRLQPDCAAARSHHRAFWQGVSTQPLLIIKAHSERPYPRLPLTVGQSRRQKDDEINWHINYCRSQLFGEEHFFDSMPMARVMFGRDLTCMGVLAGQYFRIQPETEFITFAENADFLRQVIPPFDAEHPFVRRALAIYAAVCDDTGQLACVNPPTTADALTTLSLIMGTEQLLFSLCHEAERVKSQALALNRLFYRFYDYIYQYLVRRGYGEAASWFPVCAEGKFDSIRCDIAVMLSQEMFREICLPVIADACSYLDYAMFNLDSVELIRFLPDLLSLERLQGIYWNIEPWRNTIQPYLPQLKQILQAGRRLALPCRDLSQAELAVQSLGTHNLLLELPPFANKEQALAAGAKLRASSARHRHSLC